MVCETILPLANHRLPTQIDRTSFITGLQLVALGSKREVRLLFQRMSICKFNFRLHNFRVKLPRRCASIARYYLNNRVSLSRNYGLIVVPRKFDVLKDGAY